jgi:hypothetical protein
MRVKYFRPDIFKLDDLNINPPVIAPAQLVQAYMPVDRTGKFNPFNMMYDPIPTVGKFNKTLEECCMDAAQNLWKLGKPVELFWSGGIDSSGALIALLETKSDSDILNIRYTEESIVEFPLMWEKMVKGRNDPLPNKVMLDETLFNNHDIIKVTGECGDQCFGSDALRENLDKHTDDWESIFTWGAFGGGTSVPNSKFVTGNAAHDMPRKNPKTYKLRMEQLAEVITEQVDSAPIEIKTIFDLFWWCNFCFKWQDVDSRLIFTFTANTEWKSTLSFFNTEDFQRWSIVNHDIKHGGSWETYKQPAKEYINKYIKDENYRKNKTKEPSLIKILQGAIDEKYNFAYRQKRRGRPDRIKLVLEDGQFWRRNEKVPDEIYEEILIGGYHG